MYSMCGICTNSSYARIGRVRYTYIHTWYTNNRWIRCRSTSIEMICARACTYHDSAQCLGPILDSFHSCRPFLTVSGRACTRKGFWELRVLANAKNANIGYRRVVNVQIRIVDQCFTSFFLSFLSFLSSLQSALSTGISLLRNHFNEITIMKWLRRGKVLRTLSLR